MSRGLFHVALLLVGLVSCHRPSSHDPLASLAACRLEGTGIEARCTRVAVPENRASPGRTLSLRVVVVPGLAADPSPDPLFILAGGPGQSAVDLAPVILPLFDRVRRLRDIVFVDQRGTGDSNPLRCAESSKAWNDPFETGSIRGPLERCLPTLDADPAAYTTPAAADDLDAVRTALGYDTINLWGASYGTRLALVYARQHAAHTRTITLDGVAPNDMQLPASLAEDSQRSLDRVLDACAADKTCAARFPDARAQLTSLLDRPADSPWTASEVARLSVGHPTLSHDAIAGGLRALLYRAESAAMIPFLLDAMSREHDHRALIGSIDALTHATRDAMSEGLFFSVMCAEDNPGLTLDQIDVRARNTFLGPTAGRSIHDACQVWPRGALPANYHEPIRSDVPTLILSGELDPATPVHLGDQVARNLPRSVHAVFPWVGHGSSSVGCGPRLIAKLIETGSTEGLDVGCAKSVPPIPFVTTIHGAPP